MTIYPDFRGVVVWVVSSRPHIEQATQGQDADIYLYIYLYTCASHLLLVGRPIENFAIQVLLCYDNDRITSDPDSSAFEIRSKSRARRHVHLHTVQAEPGNPTAKATSTVVQHGPRTPTRHLPDPERAPWYRCRLCKPTRNSWVKNDISVEGARPCTMGIEVSESKLETLVIIARFHHVVGEIDQELCETALGRCVITEDGGKGGITQRFGETLTKCLSSTRIVAQSRQLVPSCLGDEGRTVENI